LSRPLRIALITDIHGNLPALQAVLTHLASQSIDRIVQLGDAVSGPLWPAETLARLQALQAHHVMGNHDLAVLNPLAAALNPGDAHARAKLDEAQLAFMATWPKSVLLPHGGFAFHASPRAIDLYLLEQANADQARLRPIAQIRAELQDPSCRAARWIACGHSHVQRTVQLPEGPLVINAGSVGLQAYTEPATDLYPAHTHAMGSPHARYSVIEATDSSLSVTQHAVVYDWQAASQRAAAMGRDDWARALLTGHGFA
jgi:predicted phosphodiesterase